MQMPHHSKTVWLTWFVEQNDFFDMLPWIHTPKPTPSRRVTHGTFMITTHQRAFDVCVAVTPERKGINEFGEILLAHVKEIAQKEELTCVRHIEELTQSGKHID